LICIFFPFPTLFSFHRLCLGSASSINCIQRPLMMTAMVTLLFGILSTFLLNKNPCPTNFHGAFVHPFFFKSGVCNFWQHFGFLNGRIQLEPSLVT
jgi:hypothetical protein